MIMTTHSSSYSMIKRLALVTSIALGGAVGYYFFSPQAVQDTDILVYDAARDRQDIMDLFAYDHYWLSADPQYDVAYFLDTKSPNPWESQYKGLMTIKVLRPEGKFAGFTAYYMRNFYEGKFLFLAIHPDFRGKGLSKKLIAHAEQELKKMGAKKVKLCTRTSNIRAQKLYEKVGYDFTHEKDGFFFYEKPV